MEGKTMKRKNYHIVDIGGPGHPARDAVAGELRALNFSLTINESCDGIVLLPGWSMFEESRQVVLMAELMGIPRIYTFGSEVAP
jgi:hypothetical protein